MFALDLRHLNESRASLLFRRVCAISLQSVEVSSLASKGSKERFKNKALQLNPKILNPPPLYNSLFDCSRNDACIFRASNRFSPRENRVLPRLRRDFIGFQSPPPLKTTLHLLRARYTNTSSSLAGPNQRVRLLSPLLCLGWRRRVCPRLRRLLSRAALFLNRPGDAIPSPFQNASIPDSPLWHRRRLPRTLNPFPPRRIPVRITSTTLARSPLPTSYTRTRIRPLLDQTPRCRSV
jgi:hypothetical protein